MISMMDIAWVAGIVEGEGCIVVSPKSRSLRLSVEMTDLDVLQRLATILGPTARVNKRNIELKNPAHKDRYVLHLYGAPMAGWLQTIYPLMGARRQSRIRDALVMFKARKNKPTLTNHYSLEWKGTA